MIRGARDHLSHKSYRFYEALQLPTLRSDLLVIKTFGKAWEEHTQCPFVQMSIIAPNGGNFYVSAHAVLTICVPLQGQTMGITQDSC